MAAVGCAAHSHNIRAQPRPLDVGAALAANLFFRIVHQSRFAQFVMPGELLLVPELP
jgi:hypothetical protein